MSHKIHQIGRYKGKIYKIVLRPVYSIEEVKNRDQLQKLFQKWIEEVENNVR